MYDDKNQGQENQQVNTYDPDQLYKNKSGKTGFSSWKKGLIIFLIIAVVIVILGVSCNMGVSGMLGTTEDDYDYNSDYIGVLSINGTITEEGSSTDTYNQQWLLSRVKQMKADSYNQGLVLSIDTPGGSVYATDELYLQIKEYAEETGRPVYTYMKSTAASGGYYLAAASDKIFANRNTLTGSIGVTIGTVYDISGFLEKMGVKTVTITSGNNKAMGSSVNPLTKEQKEIYQSIVDESYEQFVGVVAEGRKMKLSEIKKLADGRIYTAKQAEENGLIDQVGTFEEAVRDMRATYELDDCDLQTMEYKPKTSFLSWLESKTSTNESSAKSEYDQLMKLMEENNQFIVTYLSPIQK